MPNPDPHPNEPFRFRPGVKSANPAGRPRGRGLEAQLRRVARLDAGNGKTVGRILIQALEKYIQEHEATPSEEKPKAPPEPPRV
jgi:hypothetical protein